MLGRVNVRTMTFIPAAGQPGKNPIKGRLAVRPTGGRRYGEPVAHRHPALHRPVRRRRGRPEPGPCRSRLRRDGHIPRHCRSRRVGGGADLRRPRHQAAGSRHDLSGPGATLPAPGGWPSATRSRRHRKPERKSPPPTRAILAAVKTVSIRLPATLGLEAGNMLAKQPTLLSGAALGARVPIILTSRADSASTHVASCALGVLMG